MDKSKLKELALAIRKISLNEAATWIELSGAESIAKTYAVVGIRELPYNSAGINALLAEIERLSAPAADVGGLTDNRIREIVSDYYADGCFHHEDIGLARAIEREVLATRPSVDLSGLTRYDLIPDEGASSVIDSDPDGDYVLLTDVQALLATKAAQPAAPEPVKAQEGWRDTLFYAALNCAHAITDDSIILHRDTAKDGSALAQLADRLAAAVPTVTASDDQTVPTEAQVQADEAKLYRELTGDVTALGFQGLADAVAYIDRQKQAAPEMAVPNIYAPSFDQAEFDAMVEIGTKAWAGVPDDFLEDMRGSAPAPQPTTSVPRVASIDTPALTNLMAAWNDAERGPEAITAYNEIIAHIDAHIACQAQAGARHPLADEHGAWGHFAETTLDSAPQAERAAVPSRFGSPELQALIVAHAIDPVAQEGEQSEQAASLEQIAQSWDGCMVDAPGEAMDVGATLRSQFKQLAAPSSTDASAQAAPADDGGAA